MVTGASRGIGLAIAQRAPFDARVVGFSRSAPPGGSGIEHVVADLGDPGSWRSTGAEIRRLVQDGPADRVLFVHAAGTLRPIGFAGEVDESEYCRNVLLNGAAGQVLGHVFIGAVRRLPGRHDLIMLTSGAATTPYAGWSAYGAGKAAIEHWVRSVGEEQRLRGNVRVAAIAPGLVDTSMQELIRSTAVEDFPSVDRFRRLREEGALADAESVASRFWDVVAPGVDGGAIIDLRDL